MKVIYPYPPNALSPNARAHWKECEIEYIRSNWEKLSHKEIATALGRTDKAVRNKLHLMGMVSKENYWSEDQIIKLKRLYESTPSNQQIDLKAFAQSIGKLNSNVCRKAKELGCITSSNRLKPEEKKVKRIRKSEIEKSKEKSERMFEWHSKNTHPMLGKKHSKEVIESISERSKRYWVNMDKDLRESRINKLIASRNGPPKISRGTWKAQWREIGGKRNFYRSNWEANYACYLQWLKENKQIADWEHEPITFWFENIQRGVRSYKPDFIVIENNGSHSYHEVKGWMDARSKTALDRMGRYFPGEKIVLIREKEYKSIRKSRSLFAGWIDSTRDAR